MTTSTDTPSARRRLARLATEVLAPWVWVFSLPFAIGWYATHQLGGTLVWGLVVGVTGSVIPMIVITRGAKAGRWDSHHVTNREGRVVPFVACVTSLAVGIVALLLGDAPHQMIGLAVAMFTTLIVCVVITFGFRLKVSMHAAVASGAVVMLVSAYGPWAALLTVAALLVSWSRVVLGDHTLREVTVGTVVGIIAGGLPYLWLVSALA
jgi:membrane-associated phospholipid phosphatase